MKLLQFLIERAPTEAAKAAEFLVPFICNKAGVEEMRGKRGSDYNISNQYQIRVKPTDKDDELDLILARIEKVLKTPDAKKLGISNAKTNDLSANSSKFSSVSFECEGIIYDVVVARGGNKGENFEKDILVKMDNLVGGIESSEEAEAAFKALEKVDPVFKITNIANVTARSGSTKRSGDLSPDDIGKIIADVIVELKNGDKKYISIKNQDGKTVGQFGLSAAFNDDLTVNTNSSEWKTWLAPFGLDPKKITAGLEASQSGDDLDFDDVEEMSKKVTSESAVHKIMQKMWGSNYYYLRHTGKDFKALKIDADYVNKSLLKDLVVTKICYPSKDRKQINIYLHSVTMNFKLEVRNPRGKGSAKPTQIQLTVMKGAK
jgi:hypothetical protein